MKRSGSLVLVLAGLALSFGAPPARAQAAQQVETTCELHIFVTSAFAARGHFASIGPGSSISGYLKPYENVEALLREYLAPDIQADIIQTANLPRILNLAGYQVIVEPPLEFRPFNTVAEMMASFRTGPRLSASRVPCYAEIRVISQMYEKTALSRMLYSWLSFRQFYGDAITFEHNTAKATQVGPFPPKEEGGAAAARDDVRSAFRANLLRFLSSGKFKKLKR